MAIYSDPNMPVFTVTETWPENESDRMWLRLDIPGGITRVKEFCPYLNNEQAHGVFYHIDAMIRAECGLSGGMFPSDKVYHADLKCTWVDEDEQKLPW
jgi:hypothetical protein